MSFTCGLFSKPPSAPTHTNLLRDHKASGDADAVKAGNGLLRSMLETDKLSIAGNYYRHIGSNNQTTVTVRVISKEYWLFAFY